MKIIRAAACALLFASATFAQDAAPCALMSFSAAVNVASIEFANCPATLAGKVVKGDTVTVTIGESVIPASVVDVGGTVFQLVGGATVNSRIISVRPTTAAGTRNFDPADAPEYSGDSASVRFVTGDTTDTAADTDFDVTLANPVSHAEQKAHVGQATATEDASTTTADDTAFEFQYTGAYVVFPPRGDARKKWWDRGVQQEYTVSIDTSNQKAATFTDDNSASAAVYLPRFSTGSLLNRARFGTVATYSRAFHSTAQNFDGKLVFEGWLPFVQVQSLFSKNRYAAPPLSFSAGWGYRDQTTADNHSHGTVFDGAVAYHLYLMDQYRVDFEYLTVVNQLNDRPATTPKTQHTWKASVLMSPQPGSAFSAVFAVENGHSGPVFTQLRQYFVGIGLQQLLDKK